MISYNYFSYGYNTLGPLLLGFSKWIAKECKKRGIGKIYFFSRDGLIMKRAFDILGDTHFKTYYMEVSRRSLRVPILWKDHSLGTLMTMVSPSRQISLVSLFDAIGLEIDNYKEQLTACELHKEDVYNRTHVLNDNRIKSLFDLLDKDITVNSKTEYTLLTEYIKQIHLDGKFAVVDIGWSGGMQRFLKIALDTMDINSDIYGYYTGIASYYNRNISVNYKPNMKGYLFDFYNDQNAVDYRSCFVGLYEMLFLERKGSVKNYSRNDNGKIVANRYSYEYEVNGKLTDEVKFITELQDGAIKFVQEHKDHNIDPTSASKKLLKDGCYPTKECLTLFGNFKFFDEGVYSFLANPKKLPVYIYHPKLMKKDLLMSRWKTGFLRKLFKIPINYYHVYSLLKKIVS
mgnify:CR=1 FL=1